MIRLIFLIFKNKLIFSFLNFFLTGSPLFSEIQISPSQVLLDDQNEDETDEVAKNEE